MKLIFIIKTKIKKIDSKRFFAKNLNDLISQMTPAPPVFEPQMILGEVPDPRVAIIARTSAIIMHEITGLHNFR